MTTETNAPPPDLDALATGLTEYGPLRITDEPDLPGLTLRVGGRGYSGALASVLTGAHEDLNRNGPLPEPVEAHLVVDAGTLLTAAEAFEPIAPDSPEGFAGCVDRLLVAARLVASVDVARLAVLIADAGELVGLPDGWRGPFTHQATADLVRSARAFVDYVGLEDLIAFVDEDFPGERTQGVAAAAAALLTLGHAQPVAEDLAEGVAADVEAKDLPWDPSPGEVDTPRRPPAMPRAADVDAFGTGRPDVPGTPID